MPDLPSDALAPCSGCIPIFIWVVVIKLNKIRSWIVKTLDRTELFDDMIFEFSRGNNLLPLICETIISTMAAIGGAIQTISVEVGERPSVRTACNELIVADS